ncbi:MAG TPA: formate--phosphoribosylaminoimidazolecarboxamide ligase family protein [Nitrososphaeraceae archaeon]|nr:formate--phosphoribosylaminoimidazolecarboxamide ligase family protein [Nitrososphaeraceae archaeon]
MINSAQIFDIIKNYDITKINIGVLGSHSALEVMDGAVDESIRTVCICQKGRETPYLRFKRLSNDVVVLDKFIDIINPQIQNKLRNLNVLMISHRSFSVYIGYDNIENNFLIPIFGNRYLLRAEERTVPKNQYYLLNKSNIKYPKLFKPQDISGPSIVKVQEAKRKLERAFFFVSSYDDYLQKTETKIKNGLINKLDLESAVIEEYVIGTYFNLNFFYSPLNNDLEFLGIERRLQTNLNDFTTSLTARQQMDLDIELQNIEIGHTPASIRESMLEKIFEMGDKFVNAVKHEYPPGLIGPFSLQSIVTKDLDIYVYDVSFRVPGNPILSTTSPYTKYYYGHTFGVGRRIAMEIKRAISDERIKDIVT